jgi:tRNA(Ile)-lysidine synthase
MTRLMPLGALRRFFHEHNPSGLTLIVGFSGGSDSYALIDSCDRLRQEYGYQLVVAHLDHGWRSSSAQEAQQLKEQVLKRGLRWVSRRVAMEQGSNLEHRAREHRLAFFAEVAAQHQGSVVVLGHQQDDVVETTLKRVLEGASLSKLHGLRPIHQIGSLTLWRPLLHVTRREIELYVRQRRLPVVEDPTNRDPRFLRSRFRHQLIPQIEALLGKSIREPLARLAQRSRSLEQMGWEGE